jgi:hypothetical protein
LLSLGHLRSMLSTPAFTPTTWKVNSPFSNIALNVAAYVKEAGDPAPFY